MKRVLLVLGTLVLAVLSSAAFANSVKTIAYNDSYRNTKPIYKIVGESDASVGGVKRWNTKIAFPGKKKPDEKTLEAQLIHAAYTQLFKNGANAIYVFAYSAGDNYAGGYTLARCMVAPYGNWEKAGEKADRKDLKAKFEIGTGYYQKK